MRVFLVHHCDPPVAGVEGVINPRLQGVVSAESLYGLPRTDQDQFLFIEEWSVDSSIAVDRRSIVVHRSDVDAISAFVAEGAEKTIQMDAVSDWFIGDFDEESFKELTLWLKDHLDFLAYESVKTFLIASHGVEPKIRAAALLKFVSDMFYRKK